MKNCRRKYEEIRMYIAVLNAMQFAGRDIDSRCATVTILVQTLMEYLVNRVRTCECESAKMRQKGKANSRDLTALTLITSFHTPTTMTQLYTSTPLIRDALLRCYNDAHSLLIFKL